MAIEKEIGTRRQHSSIISQQADESLDHRRCTILYRWMTPASPSVMAMKYTKGP